MSEAHDYGKLRESVEMMQKLLPLLGELSVRQVIGAGDGAINAACLNPYCMKEGLAEGHEQAVRQWKIDAIERDIPAILSALSLAADAGRYREALQGMQGSGNAAGAWLEAVKPLVARFDIAAKFEADAVHNGTGAAAIAELMRQMAVRLDAAVTASRQALQESDHG